MSTASLIGISLCAALIAVLRPHVRRPAAITRERLRLLRAAVAARSLAASAIALLLLLEVLGYAARLSPPRSWALWAPALLIGLAWLANTAAGLWCLPWLVPNDVELGIVAAGHRGHIVRYGLTRLALRTSTGWLVQLPYFALLRRPSAVRGGDRRRPLELSLQRRGWTDEELRRLRQAVIFSPYRDITSSPRLSRRADRVTLELSAASDAAAAQLRESLEQLVTGFDAVPAREPRTGS